MGIVQSIFRKKNCIMESFFAALKNEIFYGRESEFEAFEGLYEAISYNSEKIKGKTGWMTLQNSWRHPYTAYDII